MFTSVVLSYYLSFCSDILFFCKLFSQDLLTYKQQQKNKYNV